MEKRRLTVRLDTPKGAWIEKEAKRLGCSLNDVINIAITEAMEKERRKRGYE